jgi:hypothetical protein
MKGIRGNKKMNEVVERIKDKIKWLESMLPVMATEAAKKNIMDAIRSYKGLLASYENESDNK